MSFHNGPRAFGRKAVHSLPPPTPDADGRTRILPKAVFEGKTGDFLRALGRSPDDADNFLPTEADYAARIEASRQRMIIRCDEVEADLRARFGHGVIRPYFVFGELVWNGPAGQFLNRSLGLQPYDDWNLVPLANDERTMALAGLPHHPGQNIEIIDEKAMELLAPIYNSYMDNLDSIDPHAPDFLDRLGETNPVAEKEAFRQRVTSIADRLRVLMIGMLGDYWRGKGKACPERS
jgi:hypothetical protein